MIKDFIATLTDVETGEILASTSSRKDGRSPLGGARVTIDLDNKSSDERLRSWFDSFLRGVHVGNNLSVTITIRDYKAPSCPLSFDFF